LCQNSFAGQAYFSLGATLGQEYMMLEMDLYPIDKILLQAVLSKIQNMLLLCLANFDIHFLSF